MEFVHVAINDLTFRQREDHEPISNDFLNRNFPDGSDGTLLRIDDEWRFTSDDGTSTNRRNADWSYKDSDNPIQYHSEWIMRTRENDHDFSTFIEFVRTLDEDNFDEETINRMADADLLSLNAAVRGYDADWDTITLDRGKNAYMFRPKNGNGWMLCHWDGDRVFERTGQAILGNLPNIRTYFEKPYIKRRMNYYMTKLLDEHAKDSARTLAWMDAEIAAVAGTGVTMTKSTYTNFFNARESLARNFVTNYPNSPVTTVFSISTSNGATTNNTIDLAGQAPPDIYAIRVLGQPDAIFHWTNTRDWTLTGVQLQEGANMLEVQGIDHDGKLVDQLVFNVTKTSNAPPVVSIDPAPKSKNVGLGETLMLDANSSFDPEGSALTFAWQVSPGTGVNLIPSGATAMATFTQPGLYTFTATATDDQPQNTAQSIGIAVYGPASFSTFGNDTLEEFWDFFNISKHENASNGPHYSLEDNSGRLTINIPLPTQVAPNPFVQVLDYGATW